MTGEMDELERIRQRKREQLIAELEAQRANTGDHTGSESANRAGGGTQQGPGEGRGGDMVGHADADTDANANEVAEPQWPSAPVEVDAGSFNRFIASYHAVLVDCWAPWCAPCRKLAPVLRILAQRFHKHIAFAKLNTDEHTNAALARQLRIQSIPTMLIYKNALLVDRITGFIPGNQLQRRLENHFGPLPPH